MLYYMLKHVHNPCRAALYFPVKHIQLIIPKLFACTSKGTNRSPLPIVNILRSGKVGNGFWSELGLENCPLRVSLWGQLYKAVVIEVTKWTDSIDLMLPYTDVCIALYTQCFPSVCGKKTLQGLELTTSCLLVQTSLPLDLSLPNDDWLARILYSSGFRDIYINRRIAQT